MSPSGRVGAAGDAAAAGEPASAARGLLFAAVVMLAWISVDPFASLGTTRWLDPSNSSDLANQLAYVTLGAGALAFLWRDPGLSRPLRRPVYAAMLAWLAVSVATSYEHGLSARRFVFMLAVVLLGAVAPLLPVSRRHFADLLAGIACLVLFLCYAGVLLVPDVSIHQVTDLIEPRLAGDWRGVFNHKNIAGEMMGIFVFVGMFVARVRSLPLGGAIVVAALVFLSFTEAKSAIGFLPLTLLLAWTSGRRWAPRLRLGILVAAVVGLNVATLGSLYSPTIRSVVDRTMSDPTFTGRTEIWQLAVDWIPKRPLFGFGYGAFWQTDRVMYAKSVDQTGGASSADHAHNAVLNLAVTTGIPGAVLALLWAVVLPLIDIGRCLRGGADPALTNLFVRIWAFALANCTFESILFARGDPMWFTMLLAMFGLRYLSVYRLRDE